jgi:type IV fimbrial biogenesis protein FimT
MFGTHSVPIMFSTARRGRGRPVPAKTRGVTLIELITVIAIAAILMTIAVPGFRYIMVSYRVAGEVNGLLGDLQFARTEAIREGQFVTACVSADGQSCAAGNKPWNTGWIVFSDPNNNQTADKGEPILRVQATFTGTDTFVAGAPLSSVTFSREGFALGLPNAGVTLTLHDATANSVWTRCLFMTVIGMMQVVTPATATAQQACL